MAIGFGQLADADLLSVLDCVMDALTDGRMRQPTDREQLDLLQRSLRIDARLHAWQAQLAARAERTEAAWHDHGTSTTTWLSSVANLTSTEAHRLVQAGAGLDRLPILAQAAADGRVLPGQAEAITSVLATLPTDLPAEVVADAETLMVGFAGSHNATELRRLSRHLLDLVCPQVAEEREAARLEAEHRQAMRNRDLRFIHDNHGSILIRGSLPVPQAEPLIRIVDAYSSAEKRALDALDPHVEYVTPGMRRADGLLAMVHAHTQNALAPGHGGDRPRVVITLSYDSLANAAAGVHPLSGQLTKTGEPVPASVLRRWLCDAEVLPVVLGGPSQILDVGRLQRLVTPTIRAALEVRDGGCVFPGCSRPTDACHAHHIQPWWAGGITALDNLVLACPHHHGILEPGRRPAADRWQVRLRADGVPEVLPPVRVDPAQRPRVHARFLTRVRT